jgi:hypothetical protein
MDGHVICLGGERGRPLTPAPEIQPGPVPEETSGFLPSATHPDFQHLSTVRVQQSDLGYRLSTDRKAVGLALKELKTPIEGRVEFTLRLRPRPDATKADTPGNAFFAFGERPQEEELVKCGFRISGQRLYIVQGSLTNGDSVGAPMSIQAKQVAEMRVVVDLEKQTVSTTMLGASVETPLACRMDGIRWIGYAISSVPADFGPIEVKDE